MVGCITCLWLRLDESDEPVSSDSSFGEVLVEIEVEMELCRFLVGFGASRVG